LPKLDINYKSIPQIDWFNKNFRNIQEHVLLGEILVTILIGSALKNVQCTLQSLRPHGVQT